MQNYVRNLDRNPEYKQFCQTQVALSATLTLSGSVIDSAFQVSHSGPMTH